MRKYCRDFCICLNFAKFLLYYLYFTFVEAVLNWINLPTQKKEHESPQILPKNTSFYTLQQVVSENSYQAVVSWKKRPH